MSLSKLLETKISMAGLGVSLQASTLTFPSDVSVATGFFSYLPVVQKR